MKRTSALLTAATAALLAVGCANTPYPAYAGEQPNILIMGEDADKDTVPRNSRVFKRVLDPLSNKLQHEGFKVYDETAITLDNFKQGRVRRTDAEIIDIARSIKNPPIDVATIFSIYASANNLSYTTRIKVRIAGRLLNVRSGERLGNYEVDLPDHINAPANCNRECILEAVGKHAGELAKDLGVVLAKKLDALSPAGGGPGVIESSSKTGLSNAYSLTFSDFSPKEINSIEEYLVAFKGYKHHRPTGISLTTNKYWYETNSEAARLNRNLRRMVEFLGVEARVTYSGNKFTVEKIITSRKSRR